MSRIQVGCDMGGIVIALFVILLINDKEFDVSWERVTLGEWRFEGFPLIRLRCGLCQVRARSLSYLLVSN